MSTGDDVGDWGGLERLCRLVGAADPAVLVAAVDALEVSGVRMRE